MPTAAPIAPPELATRLRLGVMRLARRLRREAESGITPSQLSALSVVERGPVTIGALSAAEQVRPPTMTSVVAALIQQGLATREPDPVDRRVAWIMVTPEGRKLLRSVRRRGDAYLAARMRSLSPEDLDALNRASEILDRLTEGER